MFFTRTVIALAVVAGVVHVFRKDVGRLAGALGMLKRPAQTFMRELRKEIDDASGAAATGSTGNGATKAVTSSMPAAAASREPIQQATGSTPASIHQSHSDSHAVTQAQTHAPTPAQAHAQAQQQQPQAPKQPELK